MSEQKLTYITTPAEIRTFLNMALDAGLQPNASGLHIVAEEFLIKECKVPLENIMQVTGVKVIEGPNNGLPEHITIEWDRTPRISVAPTPAQETAWSREQADYIIKEIVGQLRKPRATSNPEFTISMTPRETGMSEACAAPYGLSTMPRMSVEDALRQFGRAASKISDATASNFEKLAEHFDEMEFKRVAGVSPEEWAAKVDELDSAKATITSLQIQMEESRRNHAEDIAEYERKVKMLQVDKDTMRATSKSIRDTYRHAPRTCSVSAIWAELFYMNPITARWIIESAYKLFNVAIPDNGFDVDVRQAKKDLPTAAMHYIHGMCDNLMIVPVPKPVTRQMLKTAMTMLVQKIGHDEALALLTRQTGAGRIDQVPDDQVEPLYHAAITATHNEDFI
jgi:hypothetical protein